MLIAEINDAPEVICADLDRTGLTLDIALNKARPARNRP